MEIGGGGLRLHPAVNEADQVRKMVVAEQPGDALIAELDAPGPQKAIPICGDAARVAEKADIQSTAKHAFIGAEPLEPFFGGDREGLIGYRALGRPQARRLHAEGFLMILARKLQLLASVLGPAEGAARKRRGRIGNARDVGVTQERQNGVVERRCADLDLATRSCVAVRRQNQTQQFQLFFLQGRLVILGGVFAPRSKAAHEFVFLKPRFFHPGELREKLEVSPVASGESDKSLSTPGGARPFMKFDEARPTGHQVLVVDLEGARENLRLVLAGEFISIFESQGKPRLVELSAGVLFELGAESWNDVERGMKVGELAKGFDHAVVVLEGVQARPGENVAAGFRVAVLRLVHVPQHNQMDAIHSAGVPSRASRRCFLATGIDRIKVYRQDEPIAAPLLKAGNTANPPFVRRVERSTADGVVHSSVRSCAFWIVILSARFRATHSSDWSSSRLCF